MLMVWMIVAVLIYGQIDILQCQDKTIHCDDEPLPSQTWINNEVLPVLNQKPTNACYAFVGADILAYSAFYDYDLPYNLSQQQIIDCSWRYGNHGLYGGLLSFTWVYINANPLTFERDYSYDGVDTHDCGRGKSIIPRFTIKDRFFIPKGDKNKFLQCLSASPLAASIFLDKNDEFRNYKSGILAYECPSPDAKLEHYIIVVGYTTFNGEPVIIIKNTGGIDWGYFGYGYVSLTAVNPLCIYNDAVRILGQPI